MSELSTQSADDLQKEKSAQYDMTKEKIEDIIRAEQASLPPIKCYTYRQAQARFVMDVSKKVAELQIKNLIHVAQSESDGNITLTLFYR